MESGAASGFRRVFSSHSRSCFKDSFRFRTLCARLMGASASRGLSSVKRSSSDCVTVRLESDLAIASVRALQRLYRVQPRNPRVELLFEGGVRAVQLIRASVQQDQRMGHRTGGLPVFELVLVDGLHQIFQNGLGQKFVSGHHANLRELELALKTRAA